MRIEEQREEKKGQRKEGSLGISSMELCIRNRCGFGVRGCATTPLLYEADKKAHYFALEVYCIVSLLILFQFVKRKGVCLAIPRAREIVVYKLFHLGTDSSITVSYHITLQGVIM